MSGQPGESAPSARISAVGFIGVGQMGWPMAVRLAQAGFTVTVADANADRAEACAREIGGNVQMDLAQLARSSDAIVTMLPDSDQVAKVIASIKDALAPGTLVVEMSSGVPSVTQALAAALAPQEVVLVDAPVSGGVARARTGDLTMMCGGGDADLDRAIPLLAAMGSAQYRCGGVGAGQAMKALNNLVSAGGLLMTIEALLIGQKAGLDPEVMTNVLNSSTGMTNSSRVKISQFILSGEFNSGFSLGLMAKDLGIAVDMSRSQRMSVPLSTLCEQLWEAAVADLGVGSDHTSIALFSERMARAQISPHDPA